MFGFSRIKDLSQQQEVARSLVSIPFVAEVREEVAVMEPPKAIEPEPFPDSPVGLRPESKLSEVAFARYAEVAQRVGVMVPEMLIERFKLFLIQRDLPMYDLKTVVKYMDAVAKRDNPSGYGWEWKALRASDVEFNLQFGTPSSSGQEDSMWFRVQMRDQPPPEKRLSSDFFRSRVSWGGGHSMPAQPYDKVVPLHALERVALIEREFGLGKIAFVVSDYTTDPHIRPNPDPFLMAVIPNRLVHEGAGRFVIDVWDEPGFGIEQMVA